MMGRTTLPYFIIWAVQGGCYRGGQYMRAVHEGGTREGEQATARVSATWALPRGKLAVALARRLSSIQCKAL